MPDTTDIMQAAAALGDLVARHPTVQKLESLLSQLEQDQTSRKLLNELDELQNTLGQKQASGQPIEVAEKHALRDLQGRLALSPMLRDLQVAQMDYLDLMRKIDEKITPAAGVM